MNYKGLAYRAHNPEWSFSPLSGDGAKFKGGRFNPKGVPALYLSLSQPGAIAEYNQGFSHRPQPLTLCAYNVDCDDIVDLRDSAELESLAIEASDLATGWELMAAKKLLPPTWALSMHLMENLVAGIIVPSYARNAPVGGVNLILWDWHSNAPHKVTLIDDNQRLPKDRSSWIA